MIFNQAIQPTGDTLPIFSGRLITDSIKINQPTTLKKWWVESQVNRIEGEDYAGTRWDPSSLVFSISSASDRSVQALNRSLADHFFADLSKAFEDVYVNVSSGQERDEEILGCLGGFAAQTTQKSSCPKFTLGSDQARSKRSRFITLFHTATKSCRNFPWESSHA